MSKNRQKITLPSGATCVVRRLVGSDFVVSGLTPIVAELRTSAKRVSDSAGGEIDEKALKNMVKVTRMLLLQCVGPITHKDGSVITIVDKPFHTCDETEESIEEFDQEDANAIGAAIYKLSGITKEAAQAAAPFPAEQEAAASAASDSPGLRVPAN